jgi:hypothetical protein
VDEEYVYWVGSNGLETEVMQHLSDDYGVWAGSVSEGGARSIARPRGAPYPRSQLTGAEVDEVITEAVTGREGVDQEGCVFLVISSFSLVLADLGMTGVCHAQGLGCCAPAAKSQRGRPFRSRRVMEVYSGIVFYLPIL